MDATNDLTAAEALLHGNIEQVFNERDATKRLAAMAQLWSAEPMMFEPGEVLSGREMISATVSTLQARLPAGTRFTPAGPVTGHHDLYILPWQASQLDQPPHTLGRDVVVLKDGAIDRLWVFLDKHP